jgi:hypothetical protein
MPSNPNAAKMSETAVGDDPPFDDSLIAEMVKEGIRKAREKLIDLTLRNGMLNYRHSESSNRHIRIIDQNPRFLVEGLSSDGSIDVLSLPPVETIPRDEDTDEFRAALKEAKVIDPEWLAAEDARRAAGNRRRNKDKAAERSLRDRVRAQLGMGSNAQEIERARESLRDARQRLTEYAGVMNSPAGQTGLTTHDVLWGDSSRATLPKSVPPSALEFRFADPLALDRFKLAELKGAAKALDDHAAAMGAFADWRRAKRALHSGQAQTRLVYIARPFANRCGWEATRGEGAQGVP